MLYNSLSHPHLTWQYRLPPAKDSHLGLQILKQLFQFGHIHLLSRPADPQTLFLIRLGNQVEVYMVDLLMGQSPVVLQDVVVLTSRSNGDFLEHVQDVDERLVGDIG